MTHQIQGHGTIRKKRAGKKRQDKTLRLIVKGKWLLGTYEFTEVLGIVVAFHGIDL